MAKSSLLWYGLVAVLAIGLTLASQAFVRPVDCRALCDAPENTPCPAGACSTGRSWADDTGTCRDAHRHVQPEQLLL